MILDLNIRVIQSTEYDIRFKYQSDSVHRIKVNKYDIRFKYQSDSVH